MAGALTDIAGSSDVLDCGFVTYSNTAKQSLLGGSAVTVSRHGAVSTESAAAMAHGALKNSLADLAVAITGILATMPYIALQLIGIQVVLKALGFAGTGVWQDLPIIIAFVILAAYTYRGGLRAPALVAFVKDTLIYATVVVAAIVLPAKLGGWAHIFTAAQKNHR